MLASSTVSFPPSVTGRLWTLPGLEDERLGLAIAQRHGLPEIIGRILAVRGVGIDEAATYLAPSLREMMPDPSVLADMDTAAERLARAVRDGERIALFGDYDVDGAASVAVMQLWLRAMGRSATIYIPDRIDEGYGPNIPAWRNSARLMISSFASIAARSVTNRSRRRWRLGPMSSSPTTTSRAKHSPSVPPW